MQTRPRHRSSLAGLLLCGILLVSSAACQQQPAARKPTTPPSPPAATIGGHTIYEANIDEAMQALPEAMHVQRDDPQIRARVLHVLLRRQALSQQAVNLHLDEDPLIRRRIDKARDDIMIESLQQWKMRHLSEPEDSAIELYYRTHLAEFTIPEQVHARHILLSSEKQAKEVLLRLRRGKDFASLAAEYSRDDSTKSRGGDMNWFPRGVMVKPFEEAVFALHKRGDISAPVKTRFGWHVIELLGRRPANQQSLDEAKSNIVAMLKQQAMSAWIDGLTESAGAKILNSQYARIPGEHAP